MKSRFVHAGYALEEDIHPISDGSLEIATCDPDGNRIRFIQYIPDALKSFGIEVLPPRTENEHSLARRTSQVSYNACSGVKMKHFYCEGLGLKLAKSLTYFDLLRRMEQQESLTLEKHQELEALEDLPWIDFIEIVPHQYLELFYTNGETKMNAGNLQDFCRYQHLCLEMDDIQKAWNAGRANGLVPDSQIVKGADGALNFWLVDPDGNRIELMQYIPGAKQLL